MENDCFWVGREIFEIFTTVWLDLSNACAILHLNIQRNHILITVGGQWSSEIACRRITVPEKTNGLVVRDHLVGG